LQLVLRNAGPLCPLPTPPPLRRGGNIVVLLRYRGYGKPTSMRPGVSHRTRRSPAICVRHAIAMSSLPLFQRCPFRASWLPDVSGRRAARRSRTAAGAYSSLRAPDHHRTGSRADRCCMGKEIRERASSAAGARQWTHAGVDASDDTRLAVLGRVDGLPSTVHVDFGGGKLVYSADRQVGLTREKRCRRGAIVTRLAQIPLAETPPTRSAPSIRSARAARWRRSPP